MEDGERGNLAGKTIYVYTLFQLDASKNRKISRLSLGQTLQKETDYLYFYMKIVRG